MKCGLLGRTLGHSYSPQIHSHLGDYSYDLFETEPENLEYFLKNGDFSGLNVTMPYKRDVIAFLDVLTPEALRLGAVNTIVRRDGRLVGHNTDYFGFRSMVERSGMDVAGKKCLVFGSGGASNVAVAVLQELGGNVTVVSRTGENSYENLHRHADAQILVNATPLGMYPNTGLSPVDLDGFYHVQGVLDVVYNPARTQLLLDAESRGIPAMNGLWMLVAQACEASALFCDKPVPAEKIDQVYRVMKAQMENLVLVGMPGCGKSTVGRLLAKKTGKAFVDADLEIEKMAKKTIPQIFADDGEGIFRAFETRVLSEFGKQSGLVIATGGGCVTRAENRDLLRQNGTVFWLRRDLQRLPTEGRPLSQGADLGRMYENRAPLYAHFAHQTIDNDGTIEEAANAILEGFQ